MRSRLEFDSELRDLIGNSNVYFQPPESIRLKYPCIIYKRTDVDIKHADNKAYMTTNCYDVTVISKDPDYALFDTIIERFPMIRMGAFFTYDNLNHHNYTIYY